MERKEEITPARTQTLDSHPRRIPKFKHLLDQKRTPPFLDLEPQGIDLQYPEGYPFDKLYPHQIEGVKQMLQGRLLCADEMGVGKTYQACAWAGILQKHLHLECLIICPAYLQDTWKKASRDFLDAHVVSYTRFSKEPRKIPIVILDEAHMIKNKNSKRSKIIRKYLKKTPHKLLLTGTPVKNRPAELWALLDLLGKAPPWSLWIRRYCKAHKNPFGGIDFRGASLQTEMWEYAHKFMVRRRSREVLELPPKERKRILIPIRVSEDMQKKFARWKCINRLELTQKLERERKLLITQLYVLSGKAKIPKLIQHLKGVKEPFLVFAVHTEVLETMQKEFPQSAVLHGGIPALKREEVVQEFQGGHLQSLFLSIGACSTGLTITRARLLFFAEYSFSPGDLEQAENRIWRIGQTQPCTISYLHSPPFDDWIWKSLQRKSENTL